MSDNQWVSQASPIRLPFSLNNHDYRLPLPQTHSYQDIPLPFSSPPKPFLSPEAKKPASDRNIAEGKEKRGGAMLFTIEENYYTRKNQNPASPRPPKYKPPTARPTSPLHDPADRARDRRVLFTDALVHHEERSTSSRRESASKPIIRNIVGHNSHNNDALSNSSRSLSAQNSFVSQLRSAPKRDKPRVDSNKQRFSQIMSHFERNREMREGNRNKFSRQSREKTVEKEEKYIDTLFPPVYSSLFLNPARTRNANDIKWRRLSDLFAHDNPTILSKEGISQARVTAGVGSEAAEFVACALNAVKHCGCILERMFEEQTFNSYGLYLVRIFQQHTWKSIILDEYIPVRNTGEEDRHQPAFVTVHRPQGAQLELWPYLLEKAFSYYYSAYEMLRFGNTLDFLNELTGLCPLELTLKRHSEKELTNLQASLESVDSVAIAEYTDSHQQAVLRVRYSAESPELAVSSGPEWEQRTLSGAQFGRLGRVWLYSPKLYSCLSSSSIGKYGPSQRHHQRAEHSIRKLTLSQPTDCLVSLQQKETRFFAKSSLHYDYMWVRVLLLQREFDGYRWIDGVYANTKSATVGASLAQGEYYLVVMPEWKDRQNFELTLLVWGNHHVAIEREKGGCEEMVEQACMDLAQRRGKINQLTPTLCSYNYLCPKTALIIENINNEKLKETVTVHRDIAGIPAQVPLLPLNRAFWDEKGHMLSQIDVPIPKLSSYTVVLKMRGGIDHKLIQLFADRDKDSKEGKEGREGREERGSNIR